MLATRKRRWRRIAELRSQAKHTTDVEQRGAVEEELGAGVLKLIALAEGYPDLKANENFLESAG